MSPWRVNSGDFVSPAFLGIENKKFFQQENVGFVSDVRLEKIKLTFLFVKEKKIFYDVYLLSAIVLNRSYW